MGEARADRAMADPRRHGAGQGRPHPWDPYNTDALRGLAWPWALALLPPDPAADAPAAPAEAATTARPAQPRVARAAGARVR